MTKVMVWAWTGKPADLMQVLNCVGPGWRQLVSDLIDELFALGWDGTVAQVKEKFGGLRFYTGHITDEMQKVINKYANLSYKTCEECGAPGRLRGGGWMQTLCDVHANGRPVIEE